MIVYTTINYGQCISPSSQEEGVIHDGNGVVSEALKELLNTGWKIHKIHLLEIVLKLETK